MPRKPWLEKEEVTIGLAVGDEFIGATIEFRELENGNIAVVKYNIDENGKSIPEIVRQFTPDELEAFLDDQGV